MISRRRRPLTTWRERAAREEQAAKEARSLPREPVGPGPKSLLTLALLAWVAVFAAAVLLLPERVPIHWPTTADADGFLRADNWVSKGGALTFMALTAISMLAMIFLARLVIFAPAAINSPHKDWWTARGTRLLRLERLLREDLMLIVGATILLLTCINVQIMAASRDPDGATSWWAVWLLLGLYLPAIGGVTVRMIRGPRYHPYEDGADPRPPGSTA